MMTPSLIASATTCPALHPVRREAATPTPTPVTAPRPVSNAVPPATPNPPAAPVARLGGRYGATEHRRGRRLLLPLLATKETLKLGGELVA